MEEDYPSVEIIILNTNGLKNIIPCIESLKNTNYPNFSITVVDQASTDRSPELIKKNYPFVNLVRNKVNNGFVGGNNQILKRTKAKYAILLNDDTTQEPNWISELVKIAESDSSIAALQPKVLSLRDKKMFEYAGGGGCAIDIYGYPICRGRVFDVIEEDKGQYDDIKEMFWTCGVAMFLRVSVLRRIGYLDEDFFIYSEEMDLSWRMNLSGFKQYYIPNSIIYHLGSSTMSRREFKFNKVYLLHRNVWVTVLKNYQVKTLFKIIPMRVFFEASAFLRFLPITPMRSLAIAKANLWVLLNLNKIKRKHIKTQRHRTISDGEIMDKMIRKSVIIHHYLKGKKYFPQFIKYIKDYYK